MKYFLVIIFAGRAQLLLGMICFSDKIIFAFEIASLQREMIVQGNVVRLNIDLVEAFHAHRQFLQIVDDRPNLYAGPHVQIVIRRYAYKELKN